MEINVGEFVRTNLGIGTVHGIYNDIGGYYVRFNKKVIKKWVNITKHSKDIIDLVEVGDYVNGKRVIFTKTNFPKGYCKNNKNDVIFTDYNDEYGEWFGFESDEIETVLTHEQFESNAYKIEKEV